MKILFPYTMRFPLFIILFSWLPLTLLGQIGGQGSFLSLNFPADARLTALGGINVSSDPSDVNVIFSNPALIDSLAHRKLSLNISPFYAGILNSSMAYSYGRKWAGQLGFGIQYLTYGKFDGYDISGNSTGTFTASDFALIASYAYHFQPFRAGVNIKIIGSNLADYSASGLFFDFAGAFIHPNKDFRIGLAIKNLGFPLYNYTNASRFTMPLDVQLGVTYKFDKMPLRLSLTAHQVHRGDISFNSPSQNNLLDASGNRIKPKLSKFNKISRHFIIAGELLFHPRFNLRLGYNFMNRRELTLTNRPALVGFSFGGMLKVKSLELAVSRSIRSIAGGYTCFSVIFNTNKFLKRRNKITID